MFISRLSTKGERRVALAILRQHPFWGLIANPFGRDVRALELGAEGIRTVRRGGADLLSLQNLKSAPDVYKGVLGTNLRLRVEGQDDIVLRATDASNARAFAEDVRKAWNDYNVCAFRSEEDRFRELYSSVASLDAPRSYPSACHIAPLQDALRLFNDTVLSKLQLTALEPAQAADVSRLRSFLSDPRAARERAVEHFVEAEMARWREFFDTIESKPLTPEQRLSIVVDEDATLVLAGAGSGKTSVITAKAAYLVKAGIRKPEEVLLLAFAKNAAAEMSERVEARSGVPITARTFHALALGIIGEVEGRKPALAEHATDELKFVNLIKEILRDLVRTVSEVARVIIQWFSHFLVEPKTEWDFKTKHDFYKHMEQADLRTLQGEKVKSYEELQIANWLYENGIGYEYEPAYEHELPASGRRVYCPDFRLIESGIYLEHFGVRRQISPDGTERLTTAPFVDRDAYLADMTWKRKVHAEHGTILIETYSYERQEGQLLSKLAEKLAPYVTASPLPPETIFDRVTEMQQVDQFSRLLGTFLLKFKGGGYDLADCQAKGERLKMGKRANAFLAVFEPVLDEYRKRLGARIDFEDMVLRAAQYVENGQYVSPFRHILVDEFQDISQGRARLVKALKAQHADAKIFAVGDDWQSIFRFAGSDIHLMRHFGEVFGGTFDGEAGIHRVVDLGRTFRSIDQIAYAAKKFVLKNPAQIEKRIVPAGTATEPAIRIATVAKNDGDQILEATLRELAARKANSDRPASVLILGRYRFLQPDINALQKRFPRLRISFKTIHASKGLEADHVILVNADSGRMGFPSEIADDPLLTLVSPELEPFENAEERRLMYVAMTRARQTLTVLASKSRPSAFVTELLTDLTDEIVSSPGSGSQAVECRECNGRLIDVVGKDSRTWYRCEHVQHCGNLLPSCPSCQTGAPIRTGGSDVAKCGCGSEFKACPSCESGWLVERQGRYGRFLGCVRYPHCDGKSKLGSAEDIVAQRSTRAARHRRALS